QIAALENDDFAKLPSSTFVKGMIRGYAKIVGTPATPILQAFEKRHMPDPVTVDLRATRVPFPDGKGRPNRIYFWLCMAIILAVVVVIFEWVIEIPGANWGEQRSQATEIAATVPAVPQSVQTGDSVEIAAPKVELTEPKVDVLQEVAKAQLISVAPIVGIAGSESSGTSARGQASLRFDFRKDAWVEVKDREGRTLTAQINPAGTRAVIEGAPPFALVIGNASNVLLLYGEKSIDLVPHTKVDVARLTLN
ncbi:MAG: helix-turn-helix domain-containing protein, partial [Burkholderiales bacterium]